MPPVTIWVKKGETCDEDEAVADHTDGEGAQHRAQDGAAPAHQRCAAEHHGGDDLELEADRSVGSCPSRVGPR